MLQHLRVYINFILILYGAIYLVKIGTCKANGQLIISPDGDKIVYTDCFDRTLCSFLKILTFVLMLYFY